MSWLTAQTKGLKITKVELAKRIGVSRPTLDKIENNPGRLDMAQVKIMNQLGFTIPGSDLLRDKQYTPTICPTCGGHGTVYQLVTSPTNQKKVKPISLNKPEGDVNHESN